MVTKPVHLLGPAVLVAAVAVYVSTGLLGAGRGASRPFADLDQFVVSGQLWSRGLDPYDFAVWKPAFEQAAGYDPQVPHGYPPQSVLPALLFAALGLTWARAAAALICTVAVLALAMVTVRWVRDAEEPRPASVFPWTGWLLAALVIGNPFSAHLAWLGQPTLPVAALLVWGWFLARRGSDTLAGVLLGLATFKPQFLVLPMLWLALERRWRLLAVAGGVSLVLALPAFVSTGFEPPLLGWVAALSRYTDHHATRLGSAWVVGLPSLLAATGVDVPGPFVWLAAAVPVVVLLFLARRRLSPDDHLGLLTGIQCALIYAHTNDLVFLAPLAAATWLHVADRRGQWLPAGVIAVLLFFPQRVVHAAGVPLLEHWRTPLVIVAVATLLVLSLRDTAAARRVTDPGTRPPGPTAPMPGAHQ